MHPAIRGYGLSLLVVIVCVGLLAWCGRQNGGQEPSTAAPPASESIGVLQTVEPVPESTAAPAETTAAPPETTAAPEETAPAVPPELLQKAKEEHLLVVPGSSFGCANYVRIAYCVDYDMIERSLPAFRRVAEYYGLA